MVSKKKRAILENVDNDKRTKRARNDKNLLETQITPPKKTRSKKDVCQPQAVQLNEEESSVPHTKKKRGKASITESVQENYDESSQIEVVKQVKKNKSDKSESIPNSEEDGSQMCVPSRRKRSKTNKKQSVQNNKDDSQCEDKSEPNEAVQSSSESMLPVNKRKINKYEKIEPLQNIIEDQSVTEIDPVQINSTRKRKKPVGNVVVAVNNEVNLQPTKEHIKDKVVSPPSEEHILKDEPDLESLSVNNGADSNVNENLLSWSQNDLNELLKRMEDMVPKVDTLRHQSRADKLDWSLVAFGTHSSQQCKDAWEIIRKTIRNYRVLQEVIDDAKQLISAKWTDFYRKCCPSEVPRKPLTSYMVFYLNHKDKVLQDNPGMDLKALSKHISNLYRNLSPEKKEEYSEYANQLRKEYGLKMEEFYRNHPDILPPKDKHKLQKPSQKQQIQKPLTPFKYFYDKQLENQKLNGPDFDKNLFLDKCKEQWKTLDYKNKVLWIDLSLEQEKKYVEQMRTQALEHPDDAAQYNNTKSILTKEEKMIKERIAGKPEKPPSSAYALYSRIMMGSDLIKAIPAKERMQAIGQHWKNCPLEQKNKYKEQVTQMTEQYKLEYAQYLESLTQEKREEELSSNLLVKKKNIKTKTPEDLNNVAKEEVMNEKEKTSSKKQHDDVFVYPRIPVLYAGEPEQPPTTAFMLFAKKVIKNKKAISRTELDQMWHLLAASEKNRYQTKLTEMKKKYIQNYGEFLKGLEPEQLKEYSNLKATKKTVPVTSSSSSSSSECESGSECDRENCSDCSCDSASSSNS